MDPRPTSVPRDDAPIPWRPYLLFVLTLASVVLIGNFFLSPQQFPFTSPGTVSTRGNLAPVSSRHVLVVVNARSSDSEAIAAAYLQRRGVPIANVLRVEMPTTDECTRAEYETQLENPVRERVKNDAAIQYVVLTYGTPFRFKDYGRDGGFSLDSVLATCLMSPRPHDQTRNPYYQSVDRFTRTKNSFLLLVTRLDGTDPTNTVRMIDSAQRATPSRGPFHLRDSFVMDMKRANTVLTERKFTTFYQPGANNPKYPDYAGDGRNYMAHWGAGPHDTQFADTEFGNLLFQPGALCDLTWSTSLAGMHDKTSRGNIALLTGAAGAAGAHGFVSEPYADSVSLPEIVLARYVSGYNLAESYYMGIRYIHWKDIVLGDPLCAPYADTGKRAQ